MNKEMKNSRAVTLFQQYSLVFQVLKVQGENYSGIRHLGENNTTPSPDGRTLDSMKGGQLDLDQFSFQN